MKNVFCGGQRVEAPVGGDLLCGTQVCVYVDLV